MSESAGPFASLRVVDLSSTVPTAFMGMVLADLGADVVQIEPPGGSRLRSHPSWPCWMRGKQSIVLDLATAADAAVAKALAVDADIVLDGFRPGVTRRFGLDDGDVRPDNPGLVYTSITGFGPAGAYSRLKSYEAVVIAKTGSMYGPNRSGRVGPVMLRPLGASFAGALLALQGTMAALHERAASGYGQRVDATMVQGMLAMDPWTYFAKILARLYPDAVSGVTAAPSAGRPTPTTWLTFGLLTAYSADQRWMQFAHATPKQFEAFVEELGLGWARTDPEWHDAPDAEDEAVREKWWDMMLEAVRERSTAEWQEVFDRNGDTFAEIFRAPRELFDHPQIVHDGHTVEVEVDGLGPVRQMAPLIKMSRTPGRVGVPPALDAHGAALRSRPRRVRTVPRGGPEGRPPLEGVTVVDLGTFYAAQFGSTMLTDHGARVIHVESFDGDPIRYQMPIPEWSGVRVTQGKQSLAVDLFSDEGRAIVVELIKRADIVLHSYRGGVAERMGIDAETMLELNPNLIYHHGQGYGLDGPYARRAAFAPTIAAGSGFARHSDGGGPEGEELTLDEIKAHTAFLGGAMSANPDGFSALGVGAALTIGLVARDLGAGGQSMLTSMLSTMGHMMSDVLVEYASAPGLPEIDVERYGYSALYRLYPAAGDGWIVLCVTDGREWSALTRVLRREVDLAADPRFATDADRSAHDGELVAVLGGVFATRKAGEWEAVMVEADVACVEVLPFVGGLSTGLMDEGGVADQLGFTATVEHPLFGEHRRTTALVTLNRSGQTLGPGCLNGQHTTEILRELGYSDECISDLRARKVVA